MQQFCKYGSVRGAAGNRRPYRDPQIMRCFIAFRRRSATTTSLLICRT